MRKKIKNALFELGITPDLVGFNQICSAVEIISNIKIKKKAVCKVYEDVAKELGTTASGVERGIRHAFSKIDIKVRRLLNTLTQKGIQIQHFYTLLHTD